jgi:hypothetical protein
VTITAMALGAEQYSGIAVSNTGTDAVVILSTAALTVTATLHPTNGNNTYVSSAASYKAFTFYAFVSNTGGAKAVNVVVTLTFNAGGYTGLTAVASSPISILSTTGTANVSIPVTLTASAAAIASCNVLATVTGNNQISGNATAVATNTVVVTIKAPAVLNITSVSAISGIGTYVAGMQFAVRVSISNTGGATATGLTVALSFDGYSFLSANSSSVASILGGSFGFIDFAITASTSATAGNVTISASAAATEEISGRALTAGPSTLGIAIQIQASVAITSLVALTGNGTYIAGQQFVVQLGFLDSGGTAVNNLTAALTFDGALVFSTNESATIVLQASRTGTIDFLVMASLSSPDANVSIGATFAGSEAFSGRAISGDQGLLSASVSIRAGAAVQIASIQVMNGNGTYTPGTSFILRVTLNNTGSTPAYNVSVSITDGTYAGLSVATAAVVNVPAGGSVNEDINITVLASASSATVTLSFNWTGTEAVTGRPLSGGAVASTFTVSIKAPNKPGFTPERIVTIIVLLAALIGIVAAVAASGRKKKTGKPTGKKPQAGMAALPSKKTLPEYQALPVQAAEATIEPEGPAGELPGEPAQEGEGEGEAEAETGPTEEAAEEATPETAEPLAGPVANPPSTETAHEPTGENPDIKVVEDALVALFEQQTNPIASKKDAVQRLVQAGHTTFQADLAFENIRLAGRIVFKGQSPRGWILK